MTELLNVHQPKLANKTRHVQSVPASGNLSREIIPALEKRNLRFTNPQPGAPTRNLRLSFNTGVG